VAPRLAATPRVASRTKTMAAVDGSSIFIYYYFFFLYVFFFFRSKSGEPV